MKGSTQQPSGVPKDQNHGSGPVAHLATMREGGQTMLLLKCVQDPCGLVGGALACLQA